MRIALWDEFPDIEPPRIRMWCRFCEANVETVKADHGFGYEFGGERGYHHDWRDVCVTCGDDGLEGAHEESEVCA